MALLCNGLPGASLSKASLQPIDEANTEFMAGKRAVGLGLGLYHTTLSTVLFQAPRFIPHSFGALAESYRFTPEILWGVFHGLIGLGFASWWQGTIPYVQAGAAAMGGGRR